MNSTKSTEIIKSEALEKAAEKKRAAARAKLTMRRGVAIIVRTTEKRLQIAFTYKEKECRELLPPQPINQSTIDRAQGLRHEILNKISSGTFVYVDYFPNSKMAAKFAPPATRMLIGDMLRDQLDKYVAINANGKMANSTLKGYRKAINSEQMKFWNDVKLSDFNEPMIKVWVMTLTGITLKFARNLITPLRAVIEHARGMHWISSNLFLNYDLKEDMKAIAKNSKYVVNPFPLAERLQVIEACRADEEPMIKFWFNTGLRPGEMLALKWSKIDFEERTALIDLNLVEGVEKGPKTISGIRRVHLNADAIAALTAQKVISGHRGEHVWLNTATLKPWTTDAQFRKTLWKPLIDRAGVEYRNPYQIRHTFCSAALTAGGNPWYLAGQMGHKDPGMVWKVYGVFIAKDFQRPDVADPRLAA